MLIRFTRDAVAAGRVYVPGDAALLPDALAGYYLAEGSAEPAERPESAPTEPAPEKPRGGRSAKRG